MIAYEVTAKVAEDVRSRYELYMRERHIPDVLATGLISEAQLCRNEDGTYRARYEMADRASYDTYIQRHATRLRDDFATHFPQGVELTREVWTTLKAWPH